jgi:hypothetical protein
VKLAKRDLMQVGRNRFLPVARLLLLAVCAYAADMPDLPSEHMQTWKVAYYIEGVRDWLFNQKK